MATKSTSTPRRDALIETRQQLAAVEARLARLRRLARLVVNALGDGRQDAGAVLALRNELDRERTS